MSRSYPARGPGQDRPRIVSSVKRTSSTVIGAPSDQRAAEWSEKVADDPSGAACTVASSASQPTARPAGSTRNSCGSTIPSSATPAAVRDFGSKGSRLAGSSGTPSRIVPAESPGAPAGGPVDVVVPPVPLVLRVAGGAGPDPDGQGHHHTDEGHHGGPEPPGPRAHFPLDDTDTPAPSNVPSASRSKPFTRDDATIRLSS